MAELLVYFIQEGEQGGDANRVDLFVGSGPIKIGVARNIPRRLSMLQIGNPTQLFLLGVMPGGEAKELELHERFARHRIRGEWFRSVKELRKFIRENAEYYEPSLHNTNWEPQKETNQQEETPCT